MYNINISYYVMPHYPFKTHTKTYAAVHMSRSRFWFGIWARTLVICEKTFGRKEEMLKSRCFKQSAILWRDFFFLGGGSSQDKAMRLRAVMMLRLERWRLKAWFPSGSRRWGARCAGNWDQRRCGNRWNHKALTWVPSLQPILWLICTTDIIRSILFRV